MYRTQSGRTFVLAYYTLGEWAALMESRLIMLGCSNEYAEAVYRDYAEAEKL